MNKVYILLILIAISLSKDIKYNRDCKVTNSIFECNINMNDTVIGYHIVFNSSVYIRIHTDINNIPFIIFNVNNDHIKLPIQNHRDINICVPIPIVSDIYYVSVSLCLKLTNVSILLKISLLNPLYLYGPMFIVFGNVIYL